MALKKNKSLPNGVSGEYWKITKVVAEKSALCRFSCVLELYVDQAHKDTLSITSPKVFEFDASRESLCGDVFALGYVKIKEFSNSDIPNASGNGTHKGDEDLADALDV